MTAAAATRPRAAPRGTMLLPVVTLLHQAEEWFGGFPAWSAAILGSEIPAGQFLSVNAFGLLLFIVGTMAAVLSPRMAWCAVSLATLLGVNGVLHAVASLVAGSYSPGTASGLLLSVPLCVMVLRSAAGRMSRAAMVGAVLLGILVHAAATLASLP